MPPPEDRRNRPDRGHREEQSKKLPFDVPAMEKHIHEAGSRGLITDRELTWVAQWPDARERMQLYSVMQKYLTPEQNFKYYRHIKKSGSDSK